MLLFLQQIYGCWSSSFSHHVSGWDKTFEIKISTFIRYIKFTKRAYKHVRMAVEYQMFAGNLTGGGIQFSGSNFPNSLIPNNK